MNPAGVKELRTLFQRLLRNDAANEECVRPDGLEIQDFYFPDAQRDIGDAQFLLEDAPAMVTPRRKLPWVAAVVLFAGVVLGAGPWALGGGSWRACQPG